MLRPRKEGVTRLSMDRTRLPRRGRWRVLRPRKGDITRLSMVFRFSTCLPPPCGAARAARAEIVLHRRHIFCYSNLKRQREGVSGARGKSASLGLLCWIPHPFGGGICINSEGYKPC